MVSAVQNLRPARHSTYCYSRHTNIACCFFQSTHAENFSALDCLAMYNLRSGFFSRRNQVEPVHYDIMISSPCWKDFRTSPQEWSFSTGPEAKTQGCGGNKKLTPIRLKFRASDSVSLMKVLQCITCRLISHPTKRTEFNCCPQRLLVETKRNRIEFLNQFCFCFTKAENAFWRPEGRNMYL